MLIHKSDVRPEEITWLWPGRLAVGKLAVLAGDPGLGKSWITLDMAARLSAGLMWPDGAETCRRPTWYCFLLKTGLPIRFGGDSMP